MRTAITIVVVAFAVGCSSKPEPEPPQRTKEQQRAVDSTIGTMKLPGAGGVSKALAVQDSAAARQKQLDSIAKSP